MLIVSCLIKLPVVEIRNSVRLQMEFWEPTSRLNIITEKRVNANVFLTMHILTQSEAEIRVRAQMTALKQRRDWFSVSVLKPHAP